MGTGPDYSPRPKYKMTGILPPPPRLSVQELGSYAAIHQLLHWLARHLSARPPAPRQAATHQSSRYHQSKNCRKAAADHKPANSTHPHQPVRPGDAAWQKRQARADEEIPAAQLSFHLKLCKLIKHNQKENPRSCHRRVFLVSFGLLKPRSQPQPPPTCAYDSRNHQTSAQSSSTV